MGNAAGPSCARRSAEADGNRTRQSDRVTLIGFEDRGAHQAPRHLQGADANDRHALGYRDHVTYNYERFDEYVASGDEQREFAAFPSHLHAGESAPEITGVRLEDGATVQLSQDWARRPVVVEFGSFT